MFFPGTCPSGVSLKVIYKFLGILSRIKDWCYIIVTFSCYFSIGEFWVIWSLTSYMKIIKYSVSSLIFLFQILILTCGYMFHVKFWTLCIDFVRNLLLNIRRYKGDLFWIWIDRLSSSIFSCLLDFFFFSTFLYKKFFTFIILNLFHC